MRIPQLAYGLILLTLPLGCLPPEDPFFTRARGLVEFDIDGETVYFDTGDEGKAYLDKRNFSYVHCDRHRDELFVLSLEDRRPKDRFDITDFKLRVFRTFEMGEEEHLADARVDFTIKLRDSYAAAVCPSISRHEQSNYSFWVRIEDGCPLKRVHDDGTSVEVGRLVRGFFDVVNYAYYRY